MQRADRPQKKVVRVLRAGTAAAPPSSVEERIEAVWTLTLECMAWRQESEGEPRLRRTDLADVERLERGDDD